MNVSVAASDAHRVFDALPDGVDVTDADASRVIDDEPVRVWWGRNPVDLFFRSSSFHDGVAERAVLHPFATHQLPFVAANDLAVFKALFDRPKDWLDIAAMADAGSLDLDAIADVLVGLVGGDERVDRLRALA